VCGGGEVCLFIFKGWKKQRRERRVASEKVSVCVGCCRCVLVGKRDGVCVNEPVREVSLMRANVLFYLG